MITGVAINDVEGRMYFASQPYRHHDLIRMAVQDHCKTPIGGVQGFVTDKGIFLNREEAEVYARKCGQFTGEIIGGELTSEDLW